MQLSKNEMKNTKQELKCTQKQNLKSSDASKNCEFLDLSNLRMIVT